MPKYEFEHVIEIMPGLSIIVDMDKFDIESDARIALGETWSNEILIQLNAKVRDILEDNETQVQGLINLRRKHG